MTRPPKVLAGAPCGKLPNCDRFYDCFAGLVLPEGSMRHRAVGGSIPGNLNALVDAAFAMDATHLFIVEDDSVFTPDTVTRLLAHDKPVVAGLCRARHAPFRSYVYRGVNEDGLGWYTLTAEDTGLIPCSATGLGGILINMDVFRQLQRPYFHHYFTGDKEWGQDIVFGLSLVDAGIEVFCDTDVIIGHVTQCTLGSENGPDGWKITVMIDKAAITLPQPKE
jgi:hypothetical protein